MMKSIRKWAAILMAALALVCLLAAAEAETTFTINGNGCINGYTGNDDDLVIPDKVGNITVTGIGYQAFMGGQFSSVTIPDTVTYIDHYAFQNCANLTTAHLSENLVNLGWYAFSGCSSLQAIEVPDQVTELCFGTFMGCESLKNVTLPDGLLTVGGAAFRNCAALEEITLPANVESIGEAAFNNCAKLKRIEMPSSLPALENWTFANCSSLEEIIVPSGVTSVGYVAFYGCASLESVTLPSGLLSVDEKAFGNCAALREIELPNSVTAIGDSAFAGCAALRRVTMPATLQTLGDSAFESCASLEAIVVPAGITKVGDSTFYQCANLASVTLPDSLLSVGEWAFAGCMALPEITLPAQVTRLEESAFYDCEALKTVICQAPYIDLGDWVFSFCYALQTVTGPIRSMGEYCFQTCSDLRTAEFHDDLADIPLSACWPGSAVVTLGQNCKAFALVLERGYQYVVRETGETNVVPSGAATVEEKVAQIVGAVIRPGMSDYEKALALHNWIIFNADYDGTYTRYTAADILLHGSGVCQAYTQAYALLLNAVGINNTTETGDDHIWNMIQLDGDWYHVDATWDDPIGGGAENWDFFCVTNYALENVDSHECFDKPHIATAYKYNYAYRSGQLNEWLSELDACVTDGLTNLQTSFSFTPASFINDKKDGIKNRTAILIFKDQGYSLAGKPFPLRVGLNNATYEVTVTALIEEGAGFTLPGGVQTVEEEAFSGIAAALVTIPDGASAIGSAAFADCANLRQIVIPASVTSIDPTAFSNVTGLRIVGDANSKAESFAETYGYLFLTK